MNGTYYPSAKYPNDYNLNTAPIGGDANGNVQDEQSYIENILRLNKGKRAKAYFSFPDSNEWRDKVFEGIIEEAGKDHLVMSDPKTGVAHFYGKDIRMTIYIFFLGVDIYCKKIYNK